MDWLEEPTGKVDVLFTPAVEPDWWLRDEDGTREHPEIATTVATTATIHPTRWALRSFATDPVLGQRCEESMIGR